MLLVTAFFNFVLSKKTKTKSPKTPQNAHTNHDPTAVCVTETSGSGSTVSFFQGGERREEVISGSERCLYFGEIGESVQAMLEQVQAPSPKDTGREWRRWKERKLMWFRGREEPVEKEMEEMDSYCEPEPDTTSDTAPMITE